MWYYWVIGIVLVLLLAYIVCSNNLKAINVKVDEALSGIDVQLEKRYDQLTKLINTVKGYAKHEADTLSNIVKLRKGEISEGSVDEKNEIANKMEQAFKEVNVVVERYPELKAAEEFSNLMNAINDVEEHLQAARRMYNANVSELNTKIVQFPTSLVASIAHISKREFFEAQSHKREDVEVKF